MDDHLVKIKTEITFTDSLVCVEKRLDDVLLLELFSWVSKMMLIVKASASINNTNNKTTLVLFRQFDEILVFFFILFCSILKCLFYRLVVVAVVKTKLFIIFF